MASNTVIRDLLQDYKDSYDKCQANKNSFLSRWLGIRLCNAPCGRLQYLAPLVFDAVHPDLPAKAIECDVAEEEQLRIAVDRSDLRGDASLSTAAFFQTRWTQRRRLVEHELDGLEIMDESWRWYFFYKETLNSYLLRLGS